jgi:DNA polymerase III sliding clamp (beta) subunit (PCNA family)
MKITVDRGQYGGALDRVKRAVSKDEKGEEYLKYIYHEVTATGLRLVATDLDKQVEAVIPAGQFLTVHEPGFAAPFGGKLADLVKNYPSEIKIDISTQGETVANENGTTSDVTKMFLAAAKTEKRKFSHWVPCGDVTMFRLDDFKPDGKDKIALKFSAPSLLRILRQTEYATGGDSKDPEYMNVQIHVDNGQVSAFGSDGFRIACLTMDSDVRGTGKLLLFAKNAKELVGLLDQINPVDVTICSKLLCFKQLHTTFYCREMNCEWPDFSEYIGKQYPIVATVNRAELLQALKNVMIVTDYGVIMNFKSQSQELELVVKPLKSGASLKSGGSDELPCRTSGDASFAILPRLLHEAINHTSQDDIEFHLTGDPGDAFMVKLEPGFENTITILEDTQEVVPGV